MWLIYTSKIMATERQLKRERKRQQKYLEERKKHYLTKDTPTYAQYLSGRKFTGSPKADYGGRMGREFEAQSESDQKEIERILGKGRRK